MGGTALGAVPRTVRARLARLLGAGGVAVAVPLLGPVTAQAHALVVRSDPAAGASLARVPRTVTITFSEAPEPNQSLVQVLDSSGRSVAGGTSHMVPGSALQMAVPLSPLLNGVYTVDWKTVSRDAGHSSSGTYTFGVGPPAYAASAGPAPALAAPPTSANAAVVAGPWGFYVALGLPGGGAGVAR